jgi:hypothetical protein
MALFQPEAVREEAEDRATPKSEAEAKTEVLPSIP